MRKAASSAICSPMEVGVKGRRQEGHKFKASLVNSDFQASLGYLVRLCLNDKQTHINEEETRGLKRHTSQSSHTDLI